MIANAGFTGRWSEIQYGHEFRADTGAVLRWFQSKGTLQYQGDKTDADKLRSVLSTAAGSRTATPIQGVPRPPAERVFIVHGQDRTSLEQLELVLHKLDLEPFVLTNTGGGGDTIIEALERQIVETNTRVRFGLVLMTPDDVGYSKLDGATKAEPRARQNVVLGC